MTHENPPQHPRISPKEAARLAMAELRELDPDLPGRMLDEGELAMVEDDTSELRARDEDVWRRSEGVHWQESSHAARAKLGLRSLSSVGVAE